MAKMPVIEKLWETLPATVYLAKSSTVFMLVTAIPLGIYSALKRNTFTDYFFRFLTFVGIFILGFWLGLMLLFVFGLLLGLLPIVGGRLDLDTLLLSALLFAIIMIA